MYTVVLTRTAETDLRETVDYISRILDNRPAAESLRNYVGLYRVHTDEQKVVLLRFLHGRRDWQSLLVEDAP